MGKRVGTGVGKTVGLEEGTAVGERVGNRVGTSVGRAVGPGEATGHGAVVYKKTLSIIAPRVRLFPVFPVINKKRMYVSLLQGM